MEATVRPAEHTDLGALAELAAITFPLACPPGSTAQDQQEFIATVLSAERFAEYLEDPSRTVLVAEDGVLVGYTMLVAGEPTDEDVRAALHLRPTIELSKCYVHPDHHGAGVAHALMTASLEVARERGAQGMWLGVNQQNARAQAFYTRSGFAVVGTKYFTVGTRIEDDYVLERPL
ncbi:N-acetyltransferase family protein [Cellulomonas sp. P5_C6]